MVCVALSVGTLLAQQSTPTDMLKDFKLGVVMPVALVKDLSDEQIKSDMELILRRNGISVSQKASQILQIDFTPKVSEDRQQMAVDLKLELLVIGFTLPSVMSCNGKPIEDQCWRNAARTVGKWNEHRLLIVGSNWQPEVRQNIKGSNGSLRALISPSGTRISRPIEKGPILRRRKIQSPMLTTIRSF